MTDKEDFNALVALAMSREGLTHMRAVVIKELLHYDILFALENEGILDQLTFQGGTSLRLCFGAPRYSEDLDFVGGRNFSADQVHAIKSCVEKYIGDRYGLEVEVKEPSILATLPEYENIKVDKWQVRITTSPERKDLPKQMIKIEIANVSAYSRSPKSIIANYDFLPDGYDDILIMVETLDEIMADKIVSFVSCQRYHRHRDIWDLRWLKQQGASLNLSYVHSKIDDYHIDNYKHLLHKKLKQIDTIIKSKEFHNEMSRFLPMETLTRTLEKNMFLEYLANETKQLLSEVEGGLNL